MRRLTGQCSQLEEHKDWVLDAKNPNAFRYERRPNIRNAEYCCQACNNKSNCQACWVDDKSCLLVFNFYYPSTDATKDPSFKSCNGVGANKKVVAYYKQGVKCDV